MEEKLDRLLHSLQGGGHGGEGGFKRLLGQALRKLDSLRKDPVKPAKLDVEEVTEQKVGRSGRSACHAPGWVGTSSAGAGARGCSRRGCRQPWHTALCTCMQRAWLEAQEQARREQRLVGWPEHLLEHFFVVVRAQ